MTSIKRTLLSNYLAIILVMAMVTVLFILVYSAALKEQRRFSELVQLEYGLTGRAQAIVRVYNEYRNAPTVPRLAEYESAVALMKSDIDAVSTLMFQGVGRGALAGVRSTLERLAKTIDAGVAAVRASDVSAATTAYDDASTLLVFVPDGVSRLLFEELEATRPVLVQATQRQMYALGAGSAILILVTLVSIGTALSLSKKISHPLEQLSHISHEIAAGAMDTVIDPRLKEGGDEIAVLATSFDAMMSQLRETVSGLQTANAEATEAREQLLSKNKLLEQLNLLFITRERRISQLKDQLRAAGRPVLDESTDEVDVGAGSV